MGGLTPLHSAARLSGPAVVEVLLAAGADPEGPQDLTIAVVLAGPAVSPLHSASQAGKTALVEVLLAVGAAVNSQEAEGFTALHYAAGHHHLMARDRARSAVAVVSGTAQPRFLRSTCPVLSCHSSWPYEAKFHVDSPTRHWPDLADAISGEMKKGNAFKGETAVIPIVLAAIDWEAVGAVATIAAAVAGAPVPA